MSPHRGQGQSVTVLLTRPTSALPVSRNSGIRFFELLGFTQIKLKALAKGVLTGKQIAFKGGFCCLIGTLWSNHRYDCFVIAGRMWLTAVQYYSGRGFFLADARR